MTAYKSTQYQFAEENKVPTNSANSFSPQSIKPKVVSFFSNLASKIKVALEEEREMLKKAIKDEPVSEQLPSVAYAPWENLPVNDEKLKEEIKSQMLSISKSRRNLLNAPPDEPSVFTFNFDAYLETAKAALEKDPNLSKLRFVLVPKYISETDFWKNYFYRIHVIKEAYGLNKPTVPPSLNSSNITNPSTSSPPSISLTSPPNNNKNIHNDKADSNNNVTNTANTQHMTQSPTLTKETTDKDKENSSATTVESKRLIINTTPPVKSTHEDDTVEFASEFYDQPNEGTWTKDLKAELNQLGIDAPLNDITDVTLEATDPKSLEEALRDRKSVV